MIRPMEAPLQLRPATAADVDAMREVEVDAGGRFRGFPPELGFDEMPLLPPETPLPGTPPDQG